MKRTAFLLLVLLAGGLFIHPAEAAEFLNGIKGAADRQIMITTKYPWSAVGRVNTANGRHCARALIGPSMVQIAAHCLWDKRKFWDKRKQWGVSEPQVRFVAGMLKDNLAQGIPFVRAGYGKNSETAPTAHMGYPMEGMAAGLKLGGHLINKCRRGVS